MSDDLLIVTVYYNTLNEKMVKTKAVYDVSFTRTYVMQSLIKLFFREQTY